MAQPADLEARIIALEDIEAIKKLKARYWRCVDRKLWDELGECFAEDATRDHPVGQITGRDKIMEFFRERSNSRRESVIGVHHGHNPEIEITSDTTAKGIWQLFQYRIDVRTNERMRLGGSYYDEYVKGKHGWKIKGSKLVHAFREELSMEEGRSLRLILGVPSQTQNDSEA